MDNQIDAPAPVRNCPVSTPSAADFDHHRPEMAANPYSVYEALRTQCPVAWSNNYGGFWVLTDYDTVKLAASNDDVFGSAPSTSIPPINEAGRLIPIDYDAPLARQYRKILLPFFSQSKAEAYAPQVRTIANELIDSFIGRGECDFVNEYAIPIPAILTKAMLGLSEHWSWYVDRVHAAIDAPNEPDRAHQANMELAESIAAEVNDRRTNGMRDDLISRIASGTVDGRALTDQEAISYTILMIIAGLDTTAGAMANALVVLDQNRDLIKRLIDEPADIPAAVEEFLRFDATIPAVARTLSQDTVLAGQKISAGERVLVVLASANRDPKQFDQPDAIDIDRPSNKHLSFAAGLHRCLGTYLARMMLRVGIAAFLDRVPEFRVVEEPSQLRMPDIGIVYALQSLPVRFAQTSHV
jgi:cytochrome P450